LNHLHKSLAAKPKELRMGYGLHPRGILNAYREGDLSFDEACDILSSVQFSAVAAERKQRRSTSARDFHAPLVKY
jgi:hypothetical protein